MNTVETVKTLLTEAIGTAWASEDRTPEIYKSFLKEAKSNHPRYNQVNYAYFTQIPELPDGQALEYDDVKVGDVFSLNPASFGLGVRFTKKALSDMAKDPFGEFSTSRIVAAGKLGEAFRRAERQSKDLIAAGFISGGATATDVTGRKGTTWDGLSIFNAAHTILSSDSILGSVTYSNVGAAASLDQTAIYNLIAAQEVHPTLEGHVQPLPSKFTLVVGPANRDNAYTAVETAKINKTAGSSDWDIPALSDFDIRVVVNPFLGASSTAYMLLAEDHRLKFWDRQPATLEDEKDFETKGHKWSIDYMWYSFAEDSARAMRSAGA